MGPANVRRKGKGHYVQFGENGVLGNYQRAIKQSLADQGAVIHQPGYSLRIWIARQIVQYKSTSGRKVTRNEADGTNILKGTEDALQGVLIDNDRKCLQGHWLMMGQDKDVVPLILIELAYGLSDYSEGFFPAELTDEGLAALDAAYRTNNLSSRVTGNALEL
jgi:Holliday junction resolvase RusA-like endonuclease